MRTAASSAASVQPGPPAGAGWTRRDTSHRPSSAAASTSGTPISRSSAHRRPRSSARRRNRPLSVTATSTTRSASTPWTIPSRLPRSLTPSSGCSAPSSASSAVTRARPPSARAGAPRVLLTSNLIAGDRPASCRGRARFRVLPVRPGPAGAAPRVLRCSSGWTSPRCRPRPRRRPGSSSAPSWRSSCSGWPGWSPSSCSAGRPATGRTPRPDEPAPDATDDLPGFLEHPPGSPGSPSPAAAGWPALSAAPSARATPRTAARATRAGAEPTADRPGPGRPVGDRPAARRRRARRSRSRRSRPGPTRRSRLLWQATPTRHRRPRRRRRPRRPARWPPPPSRRGGPVRRRG